MKRIWTRAAAAAVLCAVLLSGCSAAVLPSDSAAPADPLTGQELEYPGERTAAVVIDNAPDSTRQWGLNSASVVLEAQTVENTSTTLCLVYPSISAMPTVGPVTLGQDLYWRLLSGQQVIPVQRGSGVFTRNYLDYYNLKAVDALEVGRNVFTCDTSWSNSPLWRTNGKSVRRILNSLNISNQLDELAAASSASGETDDDTILPALPSFLPQSTSPRLPEADIEGAAQVQVHFQSSGTTGFAYDAASGTYGMFHADGTPQIDANTGSQAQFDNLLVLFSGSSLRDDNRTLDYDLTLGGGVWLNGGQLWQITWTQGTDSTFAFYDSDGRPLTLCAGRSYVALVSSVTGEEVAVQDPAGQELLMHTAS